MSTMKRRFIANQARLEEFRHKLMDELGRTGARLAENLPQPRAAVKRE